MAKRTKKVGIVGKYGTLTVPPSVKSSKNGGQPAQAIPVTLLWCQHLEAHCCRHLAMQPHWQEGRWRRLGATHPELCRCRHGYSSPPRECRGISNVQFCCFRRKTRSTLVFSLP